MRDIVNTVYSAELTKASPPVAVTGACLAGYPLSDWLIGLTLLYTALQLYVIIRDKVLKKGRNEPS